MTKKYRLLKQNEIIEDGDEYLSGDLETWLKMEASIGYPYHQHNFIVARRKIGPPMNVYDVAVSCLEADGRGGEPSAFEISLVSEGEKLERLKHGPKQSLDDFQKTIPERIPPDCHRCYIQGIRAGWHANERNRGYEE